MSYLMGTVRDGEMITTRGRRVIDSYLLPGVEPEGGDADVTDLLLTGAKQKVPVRPGRQRHLVRQSSSLPSQNASMTTPNTTSGANGR